jgi:hypothetical protein
MPESQPRFPVITEQGLAALRKLIGVPVEDSVEPWCTEATRDSIRHWAQGIGDDNPLWCDPSYGESTPYGGWRLLPSSSRCTGRKRVHWEDELATRVGTPAAYDYGPERCSWMSHQLTNWMGDAGRGSGR